MSDFALSHRFGLKEPRYPVGKYLRRRVGQAWHKVQVKGYKGRDPADPTMTLYKVYDFTLKRWVRALERELHDSLTYSAAVGRVPSWCCSCSLCQETYTHYFRPDENGARLFDRVDARVPSSIVMGFRDEDEDWFEGSFENFVDRLAGSLDPEVDNSNHFHCNGWMVNWTFNAAQQCHFLAFRSFVPERRRYTLPPYGREALGLP